MNCSKAAVILVACTAVLLASGCITCTYPGGPAPAGLLITSVTVPAQNLAVATDKDAKSDKVGKASACGLLGLFAFGDGGIEAAMKDGRITKVNHVDHSVVGILYTLWFIDQTRVYGE
jgi:hypothetical protein